MADRAWVSAHVFYSDPLEPLLCEAVRPLVAELDESGMVDGWFFLRYWEGGPHVRLRLLPAGAAGPVRDAITVHCGRYLRDHPATTHVPADGYAASAAAMARYEHRAEPPGPLRDNNSVHFVEYRPEHDRYGTGAHLAAVERHFVESSTIALALLPAGPEARRAAAFCAMLVAASISPPMPVTPADDDTFAPQRETLLRLARRTGTMRAWRDSLVALREALSGEDRAATVIDTGVHLLCNRLGVTLPEEAYLRSLAARTTAELSGKE